MEAAYQLHMTIGPAQTTTSAIARLAGVKRPTVQRHFPDLGSLSPHSARSTRTTEATESCWATLTRSSTPLAWSP